MAENKTKPTDQNVVQFLESVENERRREDSLAVLALIRDVTGLEAKMWGDAIVGFGDRHYKYESGREGDVPLVGFSPRKQNLTLYIMPGFEQYEALLGKLGKHKTGKVCLYLNKLADVDLDVLRELVKRSVEHQKQSA